MVNQTSTDNFNFSSHNGRYNSAIRAVQDTSSRILRWNAMSHGRTAPWHIRDERYLVHTPPTATIILLFDKLDGGEFDGREKSPRPRRDLDGEVTPVRLSCSFGSFFPIPSTTPSLSVATYYCRFYRSVFRRVNSNGKINNCFFNKLLIHLEKKILPT